MHLRLVATPKPVDADDHAATRPSMVAPRGAWLADYPFDGVALVVAFAAHDDLSGVAANTRLALAAAPDISSDDAYLVLPLRARDGLLAAFARGAEGKVTAWFDEAVVVRAELDGGRAARLWVGAAWRAREVIDHREGTAVALRGVGDPVRVVNQLAPVAALAPGGMIDRRGVEAMTTRDRYVGVSRMGLEDLGLGADAVEPTFVWSSREGDRVRVHVAISASEDDTFLALLAPATLIAEPAAAPRGPTASAPAANDRT